MGKALRRHPGHRRVWWRSLAGLITLVAAWGTIAAQATRVPAGAARIDSGRFTFVAFPRDAQLARSLMTASLATDTFPGLPQPRDRVVVTIAPDARRFREWIGTSAPEWGAAIAFPGEGSIVMQGSRANSSAGDPTVTLRHELAHLALHEAEGDLPPRWFDEGYAAFAAGEWGRDDVLATNIALVVRGVPTLEALDGFFAGGEARAQQGYALAHRAVAEMTGLDRERGLTLFFAYWRDTRSLDLALRRAYGITQAEFEVRWRSATRRRYGALALFADVSLSVLMLMVVVGPLWLIRRQRDRRRLDALRAADEAQDLRDRESALAAILGDGTVPAREAPGGRKPGGQNDGLIK